jgi:hypothetical protein
VSFGWEVEEGWEDVDDVIFALLLSNAEGAVWFEPEVAGFNADCIGICAIWFDFGEFCDGAVSEFDCLADFAGGKEFGEVNWWCVHFR